MKRAQFSIGYLTEPALAFLPLQAVGCWSRILPLMYEAGGWLKVNDKVIHADDLAKLVGATIEDTEGYLSDLAKVGLIVCDDSGCFCSPRMVRDEAVRRARIAGGKLGGNPNLIVRKSPDATNEAAIASPPASTMADGVAFLHRRDIPEHIARAFLAAVHQRLGDAIFADVVTAAINDNVPEPFAWISRESDLRAPRRKPKGTAPVRFEGLD